MGERIKQLRKALDLTQKEFGERLGVKPNTIGTYEIGRNEPIDAIISLICREFNVNEDWLRNGTDPMFVAQSREEEIAAAVRKIASGRSEDFKRRFVLALASLSEEHWELLEQKMREILGERPIPEAPPDYEAEARAEAKEYYQEVLYEKKQAEESSVFEDSSDSKKKA